MPFRAFQQHRKSEAIFDRLRRALADMRHHRVGSITKERHPIGRPVWQGRSIINAPAKCLVESAYCFQYGIVPARIFCAQRLQVTWSRPRFPRTPDW